ncbi:Fur family transcriptional regulator [Haloglycomyces albus]|uniref:Fur family transcriptional regulator n=1 Tax=Haloglycomyces albus TaxID=526067 RepID=UPI00046CA4A4|nr:transcriptional repressor [Haloglycomyces albus]
MPNPQGAKPTSSMTRSTKQRAAVMELLQEEDSFRSAQDLHAILKSRGSKIGLTTVYRTLQALADADIVDVMRLPGGDYLYRRCEATEHHHHLVCRSCGAAVEVSGPTVEKWALRVAEENGFSDVGHTVELHGLCSTCSTTSGGS